MSSDSPISKNIGERTLPNRQVISILRSVCGDVSALALLWHLMNKYGIPMDNPDKECNLEVLEKALEDMFGAAMATTITRLFPPETRAATSKTKISRQG